MIQPLTAVSIYYLHKPAERLQDIEIFLWHTSSFNTYKLTAETFLIRYNNDSISYEKPKAYFKKFSLTQVSCPLAEL